MMATQGFRNTQTSLEPMPFVSREIEHRNGPNKSNHPYSPRPIENGQANLNPDLSNQTRPPQGRRKSHKHGPLQGNIKESKVVKTNGNDTKNKDISIPTPIRKFTTTNPSTLSPTYHLVYDLTSPTSPVASDNNINPPSNIKFASTSHQPVINPSQIVSQSSNPPHLNPPYPYLHTASLNLISPPLGLQSKSCPTQTNLGESNTAIRDGSMALVPVPDINVDNYTNKTHLDIAGLNTDNTVVSPSILRDTGYGPFTSEFHFSQVAQAERGGVDNNSNNNTHLGCNFISRYNHTAWSHGSEPSVSAGSNLENCDVKTETADATGISDWLTPKPSRNTASLLADTSKSSLLTARKEKKRQAGDVVCLADSTPAFHLGHREVERYERQTRLLTDVKCDNENFPKSNGLAVKDAVALWNNNSQINRNNNSRESRSKDRNYNRADNHSSSDTENKGCVQHSKTTSVKNHLIRNKQEPFVDSRTLKNAVFKCEGDSVRFFLVGNNSDNNSGAVSDAEQFPNSQGQYERDCENILASPQSLPPTHRSLSQESSHSKSKVELKGENDKPGILAKVFKNSNKTTKNNNPNVSRKPVNRWDNIHVSSLQTTTNVANVKGPTGQTKGVSSVPPAFHDKLSVEAFKSQDVPFRSTDNERVKNKEKVNRSEHGAATTVIKGILVNKDRGQIANRTSGPGPKANSVQFIDDTYVHKPPSAYHSSRQSELANSTTTHTVREVIDRNKYIIKPREVRSIPHRLNQSYDSVLQSDSVFASSLDNTLIFPVQDRIQADQLETFGPSITSDTRGQSRKSSSLSQPVEIWPSQERVNTTSNTDCHLSKPGGRSGRKHDLGGPQEYQQESYCLEQEGRQVSFTNHKQKGGDLLTLRGGRETSVSEISQDNYDLRNRQTLGGQQVKEIPGGYISTTEFSYSDQLSDVQGRDINHSSSVRNKEEDITGEETLKYRKNLRDVCKKNQQLNLYHSDKDSSWIKNPRENQEINSHSTVVSSCRDETIRDSQKHWTREKLVKVTPRQKFEILHNRVSEKVATNVRFHKEESEYEAVDQVEHIALSKSNIVSHLTLDIHKESPRAKFERDRAARTFAISRHGLASSALSDEKLNLSCDDLDTHTFGSPKSLSDEFHFNQIQLSSHCKEDLKLSPRARFNSRGLHSNSISQSVEPTRNEEDVEGFTNTNLETSHSNKFDYNQQIVERNAQDILELEEEKNQLIGHSDRSVQLTDQSAREGEQFYAPGVKNTFLSATHAIHNRCCVDTEFWGPSGKTGTGLTTKGTQNLSADIPSQAAPVPILPLREKISSSTETANNKSLTGSGSHKASAKDFLLSSNSFVRDPTTNHGSDPLQSACPRPEPKPRPAQSTEPQQSSVVKKMSPGSVSSSGYESEINSSILRKTHQALNSTNNDFNGQSTVQKLRLRFGHLALKSVNESNNDSGHQLVANPSHQQHLIASNANSQFYSPVNGLEDRDKTSRPSDFLNNNNNKNSQLSRGNKSSSPRSPSHSDPSSNSGLKAGQRLSPSPRDKHKKKLDKVSRSMHGIIQDLNPEGCGKPNCKRVSKHSHSSKAHRKAGSGSPKKGEGGSRSNSVSSENASCEHSSDKSRSTIPKSQARDGSETIDNRINNNNNHNNNNNNNNSVDNGSHFFYQGEADMLATQGIRIYESGEEYVAMRSPVKSPLHKSFSAPQFQWEGASYLIMPTVVESTKSGLGVNKNNGVEHFTHRSISDSGASDRRHSTTQENERNTLFSGSNSDGDDHSEAYLAMSPLDDPLNLNHRAMSVDVLCAEGVNSNPHWNNARSSAVSMLNKKREENQNSGRGYVEWKTCSGWVGKTDMRTADGRNSRGYVEWDTIWTAAAPWGGDPKDDEHVYDVIAEEDSSHSCDENLPNARSEPKTVTSVTLDTPPALPERTYINRLKNNNNNNNSQGRHETSLSSTSSQQLPHSSNHPHSSCKKHGHHRHHHHHHHHHHVSKHRNGQNSAVITTPSSSLSSSSSHHQPKMVSRTSSNSNPPQPVTDDSQNYAQVHKLKGYKFSSLMTSTDSPVPHQPDKQATYSENYWHLAPVTSQERVTSWQTGDVLDYIDGLHDSMSPKRRENIYILLNNKKTRAKFSESLEIESRLLSKGLITTSTSSCGSEKDPNSVDDSDGHVGGKKTVGAGVIKRKGATAPVSSTYV